MPVPVGTPPPLADFLSELEGRIGRLEVPMDPMPLFPMTSANLSVANAATYINRAVYVTDLNILAHSNGAHWYREDTQAVIV
jgi:hypothetical protein